jgi:biotin carboxylase
MSKHSDKRLLLISHHNSYRIAPYVKAAHNLGLEVTIASQGKHSLVTEVANGMHIDFENIDAAIEEIIRENHKRPFAGILGSDDQTVELAAIAAKKLDLPHNPPEAAICSRRKDIARARLALAGCPVPLHCLLDINQPLQKQMAGLPWPCVIKPLNMSASRGVIRADSPEEFVTACERLRSIIAESQGEFERNHILVEQYIDGIEIAYEGFLQNGELETITIFDKPDPLTGPYFEETIYVTPSALTDELQQHLKQVIQKACKAYGLITGAIHAECRIDSNKEIWILEIASRTIGGDCARMLDNENFNIEELAILLAINQPIEVKMPEQARGVMMIPIKKPGLLRRVEGLLQARKIEYIDSIDIAISEGHELIPLPEGNQYLGYIFASGDSAEEVTAAIRKAYTHLDFITAPVFKIT